MDERLQTPIGVAFCFLSSDLVYIFNSFAKPPQHFSVPIDDLANFLSFPLSSLLSLSLSFSLPGEIRP